MSTYRDDVEFLTEEEYFERLENDPEGLYEEAEAIRGDFELIDNYHDYMRELMYGAI